MTSNGYTVHGQGRYGDELKVHGINLITVKVFGVTVPSGKKSVFRVRYHQSFVTNENAVDIAGRPRILNYIFRCPFADTSCDALSHACTYGRADVFVPIGPHFSFI